MGDDDRRLLSFDAFHAAAPSIASQIRNKFEIAGRWATWDPSDAVAGNNRTESGVAFNWFINKHNLKLQTDIRRIEDDAPNTTNREARVQLQFAF